MGLLKKLPEWGSRDPPHTVKSLDLLHIAPQPPGRGSLPLLSQDQLLSRDQLLQGARLPSVG